MSETEPSFAPIKPPYVPDRFQLKRILQSDDGSAVYAAIDTQTGHDCVVKCAWVRSALQQLCNEAKVLRSDELKGMRGIPTVLDFAQQMHHFRETAFIALEPLGVSLDRHFKTLTKHADRAALVSKIRPAAQDICSQLARRGILHGDIRASNIILTRDHRVEFIDFGFARVSRDFDEPLRWEHDQEALERTLVALQAGADPRADHEDDEAILRLPSSVWDNVFVGHETPKLTWNRFEMD